MLSRLYKMAQRAYSHEVKIYKEIPCADVAFYPPGKKNISFGNYLLANNEGNWTKVRTNKHLRALLKASHITYFKPKGSFGSTEMTLVSTFLIPDEIKLKLEEELQMPQSPEQQEKVNALVNDTLITSYLSRPS